MLVKGSRAATHRRSWTYSRQSTLVSPTGAAGARPGCTPVRDLRSYCTNHAFAAEKERDEKSRVSSIWQWQWRGLSIYSYSQRTPLTRAHVRACVIGGRSRQSPIHADTATVAPPIN